MRYKYEIGGNYTHESPSGDFTEGQISGSCLLYDAYNEITEPNNEYDEWGVFSYQFTTGAYEFKGINGVIQRFINSNSLRLDGVSGQQYGESEDIYIASTGPGAVPPENMSFSQPEPNNFEMSGGAIIHISGLTFYNRKVVIEPCTFAMLVRCLVSFISNFWKRF